MKSRRDRSTSRPARQTALWARREQAPPRAEAGEAGAGRGSRAEFEIYWKVVETTAASQCGHMFMAVHLSTCVCIIVIHQKALRGEIKT